MTTLTDLTLLFVKGFEGMFGMVYIHILKDAHGNIIVYKGSKRFRTGPSQILHRDMVKGDMVKAVRCKIKEHGEREGVKQTVIQRPKIL